MKVYTYREAGVDVKKGDSFASYIKKKRNVPSWLIDEPTGYAAILSITDPPIVVSTDGIGTKLLLHIEHSTWKEASEDLIAMNYNDIVAAGGHPMAFLDYLGVSHIGDMHRAFIDALIETLERYDMALVAGETAEMPDIYGEGHWDAVGFAIGVWKRKLPIDSITYGDVIIGIPSSGFHSNGWTLIRKILREEDIDIKSLPFNLLAGTRIYDGATAIFPYAKGIAHVTGGGIKRALRRILRDKGYRIGLPRCAFIDWVLQYVDFGEALSTFNMGIGLIIVVSPQYIDPILSVFPDGLIIGKVDTYTEIKYGMI